MANAKCEHSSGRKTRPGGALRRRQIHTHQLSAALLRCRKWAVRIDGQNIAQVTQDSLRGSIGMVTQDTSLLHCSIRDSIAYGRPDVTDAQIRSAAANAQADEFISQLSDLQQILVLLSLALAIIASPATPIIVARVIVFIAKHTATAWAEHLDGMIESFAPTDPD